MMFGVSKSALKSTVMLLGIGVAMVVILLLFSSMLLKSPDNTSTNNTSEPSYPTPTPEIQYQPNE